MDLADLRVFLVVARHGNLHRAATELHQTPSALSKAIRRLESALSIVAFDRIGKSLRLNPAGERLLARGMQLVQLAEDTRCEFLGAQNRIHARIAAPPVLQWRFGPQIAQRLTQRYPSSALTFVPHFENEALAAFHRGEVDVALVTQQALNEAGAGSQRDRATVPLGILAMQLAASRQHPLARRSQGTTTVSLAAKTIYTEMTAVLGHDFACPSRSIFCGAEQGAAADGWNQQRHPRRIRYWVDDLQVLLTLVRDGLALAYLPDFALVGQDLLQVVIRDGAANCVENISLVWRPSKAHGWQHHLADAFGASEPKPVR
ncbi:LysR family transcriptional regulator [Tahibacter amnicola]|uniref:LysR family transcriptional regulator n=1 Tax=Tahibacter amnicola TaxID=2976241 RepID=A0ABY6BM49_9GAMM|nr:LysR family transcriptional regulator [Tahibacter amnicola]UXI70130.1 LysR family transcriptional regulator [Tahibacter amnicola]